ncbi:A24 family peptidase [Kingella negevensis]|uniref:prepilin peptidase n=1 Tax=Kingella negevensis TaxID=1522312 RepID=UPI0025519140|nr:A24 family peptidase [Kingella negevensis]MDK4683953.1 A24 family peptidase [Kingella negevensis]MDK4707052.1 A24 family peptidase [Kingella negevensis]MDK4710632.1 A24 family peptidase [Kingella negevensis]
MDIAIILAVVFGLLIGSFLNVVIYRIPLILENMWNREAKLQLGMEVGEEPIFNLMVPPSRCGNCGSPVRPWQNVPIISWLILRGKCHTCKTPISICYPLVELLTSVLFGVMAWQYGATIITVGACLFTAFVVALTFIDADTQLLPDQLTLPLIWLGLLFNLITGFIPLEQSVIGAVVGYMSLWTLFHVFKLLTGKEGMGYGDFKMLSAIGAWLGASILPIVVFAAALVGIIAFYAKRLSQGQPMAFGPCLAVAGWFVFLFYSSAGQALTWWLTKSGF